MNTTRREWGWRVSAAVRWRGAFRVGLASFLMLANLLMPPGARAQGGEESGTLPDGTVYQMTVPANWNRVLLRDLDYARGGASSGAAFVGRYKYLLDKGYALAGTSRHRLRLFRYDPAREIANLDRVLDRFEARFGKPARVIQFGCSGGGHDSLAVAEDFPSRIDGAIALAAHTPVWLMNSMFDGWFALKTLIAPELVMAGLPEAFPYIAEYPAAGNASPAAWRRALDAAQRTPQGRARIALAFTVGQWPAWATEKVPQPSLENAEELQHAMFDTVLDIAGQPGGQSRVMMENAADGQQLSWNAGVDYAAFFENGNDALKRAVRQLYQQAGLDLAADLRKLNGAPRTEASPHALEFWGAPGRTVRGALKIPTLRMHEIGDPSVPVSVTQGYQPLVEAAGQRELYRMVYVNAPTHCGFNAAETAAAVDVMMRRLDTGKWESTAPSDMNARGAALSPGPAPRFTSYDRYQQGSYNRTWVPR